MIVRCKDENTCSCYFTIGKLYNVEYHTENFYSLINDKGASLLVRREYFDNITEIRDKQLEKLGISGKKYN